MIADNFNPLSKRSLKMGTPKVKNVEPETSAQQLVNGINVEQITGIINAINDTPDLAKFRFRATNQWVNSSHNRSTIQSFYGACQEDTSRAQPFIVDADEPVSLMGDDRAPNPIEYVLHALAACLTTTLIFEASADGIKIDEVESSLEGELDLRGSLGLSESIRNGFENISVNFKVKSDAPKEKLEELFKRAYTLSPVFDVVTNPVPVSLKMEIK
jgi:uncharacterized OsmC-like protein